MKRLTTRLISMLLALVLCFQMLPLTALAALLDNDPAYNQEILESLTEIVGSEDEAARYYAMLDRYGLLDEEGNLAESWEIWLDGEQVTLEDILALLEDPDCDLTKYVLVDGRAITLGELQTILQIEEYITYLREKYFDGHQWTAEQQASLVSLLEQIEEEGIELLSEEAADESAIRTVGNGYFPFVTSYNDLSLYDGAEQIFDGDHVSKWYSTSGQSNTTEQPFPVWAQVELGTFVTVAGYGIVTGNDRADRDPSKWILYGSNDGENWTILDDRSKDAVALPEGRGVEQKFDLAESHTFRYFRYEIHARRGYDGGKGYGIQLAELNFYDEAGNLVDLYAQATGVSGVNHGAVVTVTAETLAPTVTTVNSTPPNDAEVADMLFDGSPDTKWYSTTVPTAENPAAIILELPAAITPVRYGLVTANDVPNRDPSQWTLYGSEDGSQWVELDQQDNPALPDERKTETTYPIAEARTFRWFKLEISDRKAAPAQTNHLEGVQLSDVRFYDSSDRLLRMPQQVVTAELTGAEPGQRVSFDYELVNGTLETNTGHLETAILTADDDGAAIWTADMTPYFKRHTDSQPSSSELTWFVKLNNLEGALFPNGYPQMTVLGRAPANVPLSHMTRVQNAVKPNTHTFTQSGTLTLTDSGAKAYGTALNWGLLNKLEVVNWTDYFTYEEYFTEKVLTSSRTDYYCYRFNGSSHYSVTTSDYSGSIILRSHYHDPTYTLSPLGEITHYTGFNEVKENTDQDAVLSDLSKYLTTDAGRSLQITISGGWSDEYYYEVNSSNSFFRNRWRTASSNAISYRPTATFSPSITLKTADTNTPWILSVYAGERTYCPGQLVPVVVRFTEPIKAPLTMVLNGKQHTSLETDGYSGAFTFLYEVTELEAQLAGPARILNGGFVQGDESHPAVFEDLAGHQVDFSAYNNQISENTHVHNAALDTPYLSDIITGVTATLDETDEPVLHAAVSITDNEELTQWFIDNEIDTDNPDGADFPTKTLRASLDGGKTLYPLLSDGGNITGGALTVSFDIGYNLGTAPINHVVELYLVDEEAGTPKLMVGKYGIARQDPIVRITDEDLTATLSVLKEDSETPYAFTLEDSSHITYMYPYTVYPSDAPKIQATFQLPEGKDFTFADTTSVTCYEYPSDRNWGPKDPTAHFAWSTDTPTVATIDENGVVTLTGEEGVVAFYLHALNGGGRKAQTMATYTVQVLTEGEPLTNEDGSAIVYDALRVGYKSEPFLVIPNDSLTGSDSQSVAVFWSSNLCTLNETGGTVFALSVTRGEGTDPIYETTVTGTAQNPVSKIDIPAGRLTYDYNNPSNNVYTVTVICSFPGTPLYEAEVFTDTATITLEPKPAKVTLSPLDSYYILDSTETLPIRWNVENLVNVGDDTSQVFKLQVSRNDVNVYTDVTLDLSELSNGAASGTYPLPIKNISSSDPSGYRDVYTVTLQAKNGAHSTWSYDSFLLYVYDAEALQIWIGGEDKSDAHTMSNIPAISSMTQDQILELNRDIYLKDIITVNYGQYAWTEVADQIMWRSSDSSKASINYQQGSLYENIEAYTYTSYRPTTELGLAGLSDGSTTITATHKLTGMEDTLNVTVQTLKDQLYLFQCYPQVPTTLTYTNGAGEFVTAHTNAKGAAAIYEESGIVSDVHCKSTVGTGANAVTYLGTFYNYLLETGEGDWTKLERYPCNNLNLRQAAYAYVYLKNPDGTPYTGEVTFRGGVYVDGAYKESAKFNLNGQNNGLVDTFGNQDTTVALGADGKLTVTMDITQWGLEDEALEAWHNVEYVFQLEAGSDALYPVIHTINASMNQDAYVNSGSAVVSFRANPDGDMRQPFIAAQQSIYTGFGYPSNILGHTGKLGPNDNLPEAAVHTVVMWWGESLDDMTDGKLSLQFVTESNQTIAAEAGQFTVNNSAYPFSDIPMTQYSVKLNQQTLGGILAPGGSAPVWLNYYTDGQLRRHEEMPYQLCNMIGAPKVEQADDLLSTLNTMGNAAGTNASKANMDFGDEFVNIALNLVASDSYTSGSGSLFSIQLAPTSDPTKFLGFIEVNVGDSDDRDPITGLYDVPNQTWDGGWEVSPGVSELLVLGQQRTPDRYINDLQESFDNAAAGKGDLDLSFGFSGYAESLIYFDTVSGSWKIQILSGGFSASGGAGYTWNWNTMVGFVPFTASLSIGGNVTVGMDALSVSYLDQAKNVEQANDFLTELRIYLYLKFFAGVGIDYSVIAFKLGIFGQIDVNLQFQWLNRPYLGDGNQNLADGGTDPTLDGQSFKIDGTIGLEFVVRVLFISFEKVLWSKTFSLLNEQTGQWDEIQTAWSANQSALQDTIDNLSLQSAVSTLLNTGGISVYNVNGQQMYSLNLAPTMEDRSYLEHKDFDRQWGEGQISLFALDETSALDSLQTDAYPYANPVVTNDGQLVGYLSDQDSTDVTMTRAAYGVMTEGAYENLGPIDSGEGCGDSQLAMAGTKEFAAAAWTRQTVDIQKEANELLSVADQMMMMSGTEVCAAIYDGTTWTTAQLSQNSAPDLAPVVATNGSRVLVAWRSVSASGEGNAITNFDQKDSIVYKIYDGTAWSDLKTLYNGTSGAVKGITAAMMTDGTAAVAYTLDKDRDDQTPNDKDIYYAVVHKTSGDVTRNVRATNDSYLDENPQLAAVSFPVDGANAEHFVLGWYTEQDVVVDSGAALASAEDAEQAQAPRDTVSDIRLIDITAEGVPGQLLPDSISQAADAADVTITSNFRFTKASASIHDLSILWVERADGAVHTVPENGTEPQHEAETPETERDLLKGVKFYTYGAHNELVRFTGAIDVAEMGSGTLIDHFDAYVSNAETNEVKAVILGTTYGADGLVTKTVTLADDEGTQAQIQVPSKTTAMYTATETYEDKIAIPAVLADYKTVRKGAGTQIMFTVENKGIHAIQAVTITLDDGTEATHTTSFNELNILPGSSMRLYADYTVPVNDVKDLSYTVQAAFAANQTKEVSGQVYLDLPDIEILQAEIVREEEGERDIRFLLNNAADADLAESGLTVKVGFYTDATCQTPVDELDPITISENTDLAMIDAGGCLRQFTFDVGAYLDALDEDEIPENGLTVYMKAQVLRNGTVQGEPVSSNNFSSVVIDNLQARTGQDAIITSSLTKDEDRCTVTVSIQNTRLSQTTTGNIIVTLLDQDGNVLGQKQSYTEETGLLTLSGEEKLTKDFVFTENFAAAASAQVSYSALLLHEDNAALASLSFSNIPGVTLDSFVQDETSNTYRARVCVEGVTSTAVIAAAESPTAKITLAGETGGSNTMGRTVPLDLRQPQEITITVTDGSASNTYILTVAAHDYRVSYNWPSDFSAVTAAITCPNCSADHELACDLTSQWDKTNSALSFTAACSLGSKTFSATRTIRFTVAGKRLTITNSMAGEDEPVNMVILAAAYNDDGKMTGCQIEETVTGVTTVPLTISGNLKVFLLQPDTYIPLTPCIEP